MMYAVAAQRSAVERHSGALAEVPTFDVIDVPELCLRNLATLLPAAASGVALLHLGETTATVILVRGTTFYFARQMDLQTTAPIAGGNEPDARLDAGSIVLELQRSLDYYERHFDQPPITRIAVSPSGKRASLLAADLGRETGFEVETLDLASLLKCETSIESAVDSGCLLAVGAALREEHRSL
jgi:MSHA biogenesis protein MshI